jgi:hypothetical protein
VSPTVSVNLGPATARDAARVLGSYSRRFAAGAFATPTAKELETPGSWEVRGGAVLATKTLTRDSKRTDYAGLPYTLGKGWRVVTHLSVDDGAPVPDLCDFHAVNAYLDDRHVTAALRRQGRELIAVRVAASSELIGVWGLPGDGRPYPVVERATLTELPLHVSAGQRAAVTDEVADLRGWADDYPFYSDGTWGALNLRGFWPDDPTRGVKPAEMSKAWKAEHPADLHRDCDWTTLARITPQTVALVRRITDPLDVDEAELERVRILRMAGNAGRGGKLGRHTDVTDKASGVRDGMIIRLHVPLVTHPAITMSAWGLSGRRTDVHLPAWTLWYLDARKPHAVTNPTGIDRLHLVIDCQANQRTRDAITAGVEHAR